MAKSALKFKDSVAAYEQLAGQIAARRFVPIYLLMGEESYFIDAIAEQIATTVLGEAERAFNQLTVYGKASEAGQVINLCRQRRSSCAGWTSSRSTPRSHRRRRSS